MILKFLAKNVVENAKILSETLKNLGYEIFSGGTDTHLVLIDLRPLGLTGKEAEKSLVNANLFFNKNGIPYDEALSWVTFV